MTFEPTLLRGVVLVTMEEVADERGHFARTFDRRAFAAAGLPATLDEAAVSWNRARHTLRGLHWQAAPHAQAKLVRCTRGAVYDVAVDVRPASPTHGRWIGVELSARAPRMLFVGEGIAHGFLTLEADCEVSYLIAGPRVAPAERGARWNDPTFAIDWPAVPDTIRDRDREFPDYVPERSA